MNPAVFMAANKRSNDSREKKPASWPKDPMCGWLQRKELGARLDAAFTSAQRAIDRMESEGIVTLIGDAKRNRVYCARAILEILEEPPHIVKTPRRVLADPCESV